jgi:hypothetical protein
MKSIPKVLLITEKWAEYHPKSALSCTQHMLVETLQDFAGPAASIIYPDEELVNTGQTIDDVVSKSFTKSKPEYVVFDYFHSKTMSISLIEQMRAAGTKVVCIWFDTRFPEDSHKGLKPPFWTPTHEAYAKAVNLNIVFDCLVDHLGKLFVTMVGPQNKKFFNQKNNLKSFDVSFVGNVDRSAHRKETHRTPGRGHPRQQYHQGEPRPPRHRLGPRRPRARTRFSAHSRLQLRHLPYGPLRDSALRQLG